jgi:8-oxo-dGTP diphosphatase
MPSYEYPRPAVTVDVVALRGDEPGDVLLIRRGIPPFEGRWALPGGFVNQDEPLEVAARRELAEETGLVAGPEQLPQVGTFGDPGRDPRGWTVTTVFLLEVDAADAVQVAGGDDAAEAAWHPLNALPPLAFDHDRIIATAVAARPKGGVRIAEPRA